MRALFKLTLIAEAVKAAVSCPPKGADAAEAQGQTGEQAPAPLGLCPGCETPVQCIVFGGCHPLGA